MVMMIISSKKRKRASSYFYSRNLLSCFAVGCLTIGIWNLQIAHHRTDLYNTNNTNNSESELNQRGINIWMKQTQQQQHQSQSQSSKHEWKESNFMVKPPRSIEKLEDNPDFLINQIRQPTHTACQNTRGIFHIAIADRGGGVGTALFQLLIDQIIYAELQNLTPWIHLIPNVSDVIDDPIIHSSNPNNKTITFRAYTGSNLIPYVQGRHWRDMVPGALNETAIRMTTQQQIHVNGTGIWGHYFEPVSSFVPGDSSCENKLYVTLGLKDIYLVIPGLHGYADISVRCWRYDFLPDYVSQPHKSLYVWLTPQRQRAARIVQQYFQLRPYLIHRAQNVNPNCSIETNPCLGLHIRHSDKAAGRRVLGVAEFLPFCQQFVELGGNQIYLATDSDLVLKEIHNTWPQSIVSKIVSTSNIVRSTDTTPVFDMASHHRTNQEVLVEITALSQCQFMIHGHSAVSEAAIWMNFDLHYTSINLEDDDHLNETQFKLLMQMVMERSVPKTHWPQPIRKEDLWPPLDNKSLAPELKQTNHACNGYDGVLLISSVGRKATAGPAFFNSILNQLLYAERYNLLPWIHLNHSTSSIIYDDKVHVDAMNRKQTVSMLLGMSISMLTLPGVPNSIIPDRPITLDNLATQPLNMDLTNGIWNTYFEPVSNFVPGDKSCQDKPLIEMGEMMVTPGLKLFTPWSVKAWKYDGIPESLLSSEDNNTAWSIKSWLSPMREKASTIIQKYYNFKPYISNRANEVNSDVGDHHPCLGVHVRLSDKKGKHRRLIKAGEYLPYMEAFVKGGGRVIYIATDTQRPLQYMYKTFPSNITRLIRTQGHHIVRSSNGDWPTHILDDHHRVNSETLVDILALSKCSILLHGYSTVSEAAIYLNPSLHNHSINLEEPYRLSPNGLERLTRYMTGIDKTLQFTSNDNVINGVLEQPLSVYRKPVILRQSEHIRTCRSNAIVYLAQKVHSSYGRDSYSKLLRSLDLLNKNYLSIDNHIDNTDIFIFHTGDFNQSDVTILEEHLGFPNKVSSSSYGIIHLVDISGTSYWARPKSNINDNPKDWYAWPLFSEGYRRMMHFFAIDIWEFFVMYNNQFHCKYRYIFRLDEDSYIHSPITYDIFEHMRSRQYVYGYRMCAYEMKVTQRMSTMWLKRYPKFVPKRELDLNMCGFYNNFFVADLHFFQSPAVLQFLRFIDKQGHIYRRRLGDLMIHSMAVYWFSPKEHIHRFLDFTYEHGTYNETNGCLLWGGMQAGYNDPNAHTTLSNYNKTLTIDLGCVVNATNFTEIDLSPSYAHIPSSLKGKILLPTITAGNVEFPTGKLYLSG